MQPNKGLSGRDSFSTCQTHDIFTHIRHPQMKISKPLEVENLDTLENEAIKKEIELLKGMVEGSALSTLRLALKGSKFLFGALIFPAQLGLFIIPKFVMRNILPKMMKLTKEAFFACSNSFNFVIQKIAKQAKVITHLVEALKPYHAILKSQLKKLTENFLSPFKKTAEFFKGAASSLAKPFVAAAAFFGEAQEKLKIFAQKAKTFVGKVTNLTKQSENTLHQTVAIQPEFFLKTAFTQSLSLTKKIYRSTSNQVKSFAKAIQNKFQSASLKAKSLTKSAKNFVARIAKPVVDIAKVYLNKISKAVNETKKKVSDVVTPKVKAVTDGIYHVLERTAQTLKPPFVFAIAFINQINQNAIHLFFNNPGVQILKAQYAVLKKITVKIERIQVAILKTIERVRKEISQFAKRQGQKFKNHAVAALKKASSAVKTVTSKIFSLFTTFKKFVVAILKWCRIMIKFTGYLIRELFRELQVSA